MNKLLTLFVLLAIASTSIAQDSYGVTIANVNSAISIGLIDYTNPGSGPLTKLTITGMYYPASTYQLASYNYNGQYLTFIALETGNNSPFLVTVNCGIWKVVSEIQLSAGSFAGLQYDQTANQNNPNLFTTSWNGNGLLYINKMITTNGALTTVDYFAGNFLTSAFDNQYYYCTFTNTSGIFTKLYTTFGQLVAERQFGFSGTNLQVYSGPSNMFYNPNINSVMASVTLRNTDGTYFSTLAYMNWNAGQFQMTNMATHSGFTIAASVADKYRKNLVYSVGFLQNQFYLYTFSPASNTGLNVYSINTPVLSAF